MMRGPPGSTGPNLHGALEDGGGRRRKEEEGGGRRREEEEEGGSRCGEEYGRGRGKKEERWEEHRYELKYQQVRSYAVFCKKKKKKVLSRRLR